MKKSVFIFLWSSKASGNESSESKGYPLQERFKVDAGGDDKVD